MSAELLFLAVPRVCLQFLTVVFPDITTYYSLFAKVSI